jgi:hypothetical protein
MDHRVLDGSSGDHPQFPIDNPTYFEGSTEIDVVYKVRSGTSGGSPGLGARTVTLLKDSG